MSLPQMPTGVCPPIVVNTVRVLSGTHCTLSMAPREARMPNCICPPSKAGPVGVEPTSSLPRPPFILSLHDVLLAPAALVRDGRRIELHSTTISTHPNLTGPTIVDSIVSRDDAMCHFIPTAFDPTAGALIAQPLAGIAGPRAGRWFDHEAGVGGDGLELIRHHKVRTSVRKSSTVAA